MERLGVKICVEMTAETGNLLPFYQSIGDCIEDCCFILSFTMHVNQKKRADALPSRIVSLLVV